MEWREPMGHSRGLHRLGFNAEFSVPPLSCSEDAPLPPEVVTQGTMAPLDPGPGEKAGTVVKSRTQELTNHGTNNSVM